jgi:hypothetical protein
MLGFDLLELVEENQTPAIVARWAWLSILNEGLWVIEIWIGSLLVMIINYHSRTTSNDVDDEYSIIE